MTTFFSVSCTCFWPGLLNSRALPVRIGARYCCLSGHSVVVPQCWGDRDVENTGSGMKSRRLGAYVRMTHVHEEGGDGDGKGGQQ